MKARPQPPSSECMEQHRIGISRFVRVVLVPQLASAVIGIEKRSQLVAQHFDLPIGQDANSRQVALFVIKRHLVVAQPKPLPLVA